MAHFDYLQLSNHKGLKSATLEKIGKINVLCGPNNSGKTTALECIASTNRRKMGFRYSQILAEKITKDPINGLLSESDQRAYDSAVMESWGKKVWTSQDGPAILSSIQHIFRTRTLRNLPVNSQNFLNQFTGTLNTQPQVVLIPAKRKLDSLSAVAANQLIQPEGSGILNYLFYAKNQNEATGEQKYLQIIKTGFQDITGGCAFETFITQKSQVDLHFRSRNGFFLKADDCGLGLRDLIIILYFAIASDHEIVLVEEPENHLHPEIQRRLISFLRNNTTKQFFLSTHSSVFLNTQFADHVFTCKLADSVQIEEATSRANLLTELGYSIADNLISDLVILCEGPTDKPVIEEFLKKMGVLESHIVKVWPLGGDIMAQLDLTVFSQSYKIIALLDQDPKSGHVRKQFIKNCDKLKIEVFQLERYSIENYFSISAISSAIKNPIPAGIIQLNPNERVSDQLKFDVKGNSRKIAAEMTIEDIEKTDFYKFLERVVELLKKA